MLRISRKPWTIKPHGWDADMNPRNYIGPAIADDDDDTVDDNDGGYRGEGRPLV